MAINQRYKKSGYKVLKIAGWFSLVCLIALTTASYFVYKHYSRDLPDLKDVTNYRPTLVNEIYSSDGQLVGKFGHTKRKLVDIDHIPRYLVNAFIAVEDRRFLEHKGLDTRAVLRAIVQNFRRGNIVEGGSTITQQVAKNLILTSERTFTRKIKEAILSYRIEKNLSKDEILYLYLNHIYLAGGIYGVEAASNSYFGKSSKDINVSEAALLAGIPRRPEKYSPRKNLAASLERQKLVLKIMKQEGVINARQYEQGVNYPIRIVASPYKSYQTAPYFVEYARKYLENKVGEEKYTLGGYKVITTLNVDLNLAAEWAVKRGLYNYESRWDNNFIIDHLDSAESIEEYLTGQQEADYKDETVVDAVVTKVSKWNGPINVANVSFADYTGEIKYVVYNRRNNPSPESIGFNLSDKHLPASSYKGIYIIPEKLSVGDVISVQISSFNNEEYTVSIEPRFQNEAQAALISIDKSGSIVAMVGGVDFRYSKLNRATQALRQPGSAFKPLVYSAALDKGYTQTSMLLDMPVTIGEWEPKNYDDEYRGELLLKEALLNSRNLASVRLIMDIDPTYAADYSRQFKFESSLNPYPSLALGGSEVTLLEMTRAYSVFANGGQWIEPRFILRIYDRNNQIIENNTGKYFVDKKEILKRNRLKQRNRLLKELYEKKGKYLPESLVSDELIQEEEFTSLDYENIDSKSGFLAANEFIELLRKSSLTFDAVNDTEKIISEDTAYIVTNLLQAVVKEGTAVRANFLNSKSPIAGKTGTSNDFTDAWFVGYSPELVTGVWVGNDNHSTLGEEESGARAALPIWISYMNSALDKYKAESFKVPEGIKFFETQYGKIPYSIESLIEETPDKINSQITVPPNLLRFIPSES